MTALKEETPTPRCDAKARMVPDAVSIRGRFVFTGSSAELVSAEFARTLEREIHAQAREVGKAERWLSRRPGHAPGKMLVLEPGIHFYVFSKSRGAWLDLYEPEPAPPAENK